MFISVPWACPGGEEGKGQYKQQRSYNKDAIRRADNSCG